MFKRSVQLPAPGTETFFLWGPRQTGKSTLLRETYPDAIWIDLLKADEYRRYLQNPEILREELGEQPGERCHVVIDEVQKVPAILDEVHWLHENRGVRFALCGSSARKVKRGHANLLGGRAIRYELFGLTSKELGSEFDLERALNHGVLPPFYQSTRPVRRLNAYVADYLKEEVAAEGLVRNLPVFSEFLNIAALSDAELVSFSSIARECGTSSHTIKSYFEILTDTMLGRWLPAYRARPKRRVIGSPKFYFSDVGVSGFLAKRGKLEPGSALFGKAFENWICHELSAYLSYSESFEPLSYWRLAGGTEVDFIIGSMRCAIEAKSSKRVTSDHLRGLRSLVKDHPKIERRYVVSLVPKSRTTEDGIKILTVKEFTRRLWKGELF